MQELRATAFFPLGCSPFFIKKGGKTKGVMFVAEKKTKKDKLVQVTSGIETIVGDGPKVEVEGKTYLMRRLGMQDTFKVIKIIGIGVNQLAGTFGFQGLDTQTMIMAMVAAIPYAEDEILDLFADIVGVKPEEIRDPNKFPIGSEIAIIEALSNHQDLKAFFTQLQNLANSNPAIKQAMQQATAEAQ